MPLCYSMFQTFQYLLLANLLCLDSKLFPMTHGDADFNLNTFQDTNDLVSFAFFGDRLLRQSMGQIKFWDQENSTSMFVCVNNGKFVYVWFYWFLTTCICPKVCFIFMKFPVSQQWTLNSSYKLSSISYLYHQTLWYDCHIKSLKFLEYVSPASFWRPPGSFDPQESSCFTPFFANTSFTWRPTSPTSLSRWTRSGT